MAKTAGKFMAALALVAFGVPGTIPAALADEPQLPAMGVFVSTKTGIAPPDVLVRAQAEAARIYAAAGVRLVWTNPSPSAPRLTMMVSYVNLGPTRGAADAMGSAPAADEGTGRLAYAYYDRIQASALEHRTDVAKVLGSVMAHELGHLLLARGAHSRTGIMNGHWGEFEMTLLGASRLMFTNEQARSIRDTVTGMMTNPP